MARASASGNASVKSAMAMGASFSPTSLGVAASALKAGKMVDTPVGQLIVASCVVDDVLALILLSMFKVLVKPDPSIMEYFLPIISSVGFLIVLGRSAVTWRRWAATRGASSSSFVARRSDSSSGVGDGGDFVSWRCVSSLRYAVRTSCTSFR